MDDADKTIHNLKIKKGLEQIWTIFENWQTAI